MIKLITIDLDGTLLTDDKQVPPEFWSIAEALFRRGVAIVIASGRPSHNIVEVFDKMRDRLYFACDNGTYVLHEGKELLVNRLPQSSIERFITISRKIEGVYPVMCGKDVAFIEDDQPEFKSQALKYYREYLKVEDLTRVAETVLKISFCDLVDAESNSYPWYKKFEKEYSVAVSGKMWLDITSKTGTKGNAIRLIQQHLEVKPEETLAFGDYLNDLDMIQNAHYSYAMKNAHPKIQETAKFITRYDNNNYGVIKTLKELFELS